MNGNRKEQIFENQVLDLTKIQGEVSFILDQDYSIIVLNFFYLFVNIFSVHSKVYKSTLVMLQLKLDI